ncbi:MAG: enoyl-CoA hydratase/isomerase family protein [Acidimicrobiia bacterium]|nr:enoyl-CoA hydratase/isomerase family protein [Acidimicrobiia bacterium]
MSAIPLDQLKVVSYEVDDVGVALVTLRRPERLNAWTGRMHAEYRSALAAAEADDAVRAIVVTGAGRGFCAGADTAALDGHVERGAYDSGVVVRDLANPGYGVRPEYDQNFAFHYGIPKPIVAAVNGPAAGVGLVLACYCDVRFAAGDAKLTTAAPRLGLPAEYGLSWVLPRLVGTGHAADLLLSSRVVLGTEAATMGLVNLALPAAEVLDHSLAYARRLATEVSPSAVAAAKAQLYADLHGDVGTAVARSETLLAELAQGPDYAEGVRAHLEKRPPHF